MKCPLCDVQPSDRPRLLKHMTGTLRYRGHAMSDAEAEAALVSQARAPVSVLAPAVVSSIAYGPMPNAEQFLRALFDRLATDKVLPKYSFERRVDAMLAIFLPEILSKILEGPTTYVVPEFPLKKRSNNRSTNVDALLHHVSDVGRPSWVFAELKTDSDSVNAKQLARYRHAIARGMPALLEELESLRAASSKKPKYDALQARLAAVPASASWPIRMVYIAPDAVKPRDLGADGRWLSFGELAELDLDHFGDVWRAFRVFLRETTR